MEDIKTNLQEQREVAVKTAQHSIQFTTQVMTLALPEIIRKSQPNSSPEHWVQKAFETADLMNRKRLSIISKVEGDFRKRLSIISKVEGDFKKEWEAIA